MGFLGPFEVFLGLFVGYEDISGALERPHPHGTPYRDYSFFVREVFALCLPGVRLSVREIESSPRTQRGVQSTKKSLLDMKKAPKNPS